MSMAFRPIARICHHSLGLTLGLVFSAEATVGGYREGNRTCSWRLNGRVPLIRVSYSKGAHNLLSHRASCLPVKAACRKARARDLLKQRKQGQRNPRQGKD